METPILDYVRKYGSSDALRLHMPGHKGKGIIGAEAWDITEIEGADSLYEAHGIIKESEENASALFGTAATVYSTEGSSLCIKTMLSLTLAYAKNSGRSPLIIAGRNAHKAFYSAAVLLDFDFEFIPEWDISSYLSCNIDFAALEEVLKSKRPAAVYITSPDYLGNTTDIKAVAALCRKYDCLLLVDNAHGAYLKFLAPSRHPIDLGADMCCDSAHKTLPVLTGGAYLHFSENIPAELVSAAKEHMVLFGSTSPSYLILSSLDGANKYMAEGYAERLISYGEKCEETKKRIRDMGLELTGDEVLKITLMPKSFGYTGNELCDELLKQGIVSEFSDRDHAVMMLTPENGEKGLLRLERALEKIEKRPPLTDTPPRAEILEKVMSPRKAFFSNSESVPAEKSLGRVLASVNIGCPPAVPIVISGERINSSSIELFKYYGITAIRVVSE